MKKLSEQEQNRIRAEIKGIFGTHDIYRKRCLEGSKGIVFKLSIQRDETIKELVNEDKSFEIDIK